MTVVRLTTCCKDINLSEVHIKRVMGLVSDGTISSCSTKMLQKRLVVCFELQHTYTCPSLVMQYMQLKLFVYIINLFRQAQAYEATPNPGYG